jgi:hypothetical protein
MEDDLKLEKMQEGLAAEVPRLNLQRDNLR